jgi:site-specific recombinase XerD
VEETPTAATVDDAVAAYLTAEDRAPKTLVKYAQVLKRMAELARGRHVSDMSGIDVKFVDAYRQKRTADKASPKTKHTESVIIRQLVNFAVRREMLAADTLKGLKLRRPKPTRQFGIARNCAFSTSAAAQASEAAECATCNSLSV